MNDIDIIASINCNKELGNLNFETGFYFTLQIY